MITYEREFSAEVMMLVVGGLMVLLVAGGIFALGTFLGRIAGGRTKVKTRFLCLLPTAAAILISIAGFIFNIGWCRIMLIFLLIPIWYPLLLVVSASASAPAMKQSALIRTCYIISHVFYVLSGLVLPDVGDEGPSYMFFGLIKYSHDGLMVLSAAMFIVSIATMIIQIVVAASINKASRQSQQIQLQNW
ncbi:MAG: hypothetical protein E7554_08105 [Ruminococcaceae bacterium]|nr:hypothetical protein [Oscillospiraceae bacterium]